MNENTKQILADAMEYGSLNDINDGNINDILEFLSCCPEMQSEVVDEYRWWNEVEYVVQVKDIFLKYYNAESTGDNTPTELGYEGISSINDIIEVQPKVIQTTIYV